MYEVKYLEKYEYQGRGKFEPEIEMETYLLALIESEGPITRTQISKMTSIPRTTIYDTVEKLIFNEKVEKYSIKSFGNGRPKVYYRIPL